MSKALRVLLERKQKAVAAAQAITNAAANDGARDLTADELQAINGHLADAESLDAQITTQRRVDDAMRSMPAAGALELPGSSVVLSSQDNRIADPRRGFANFGEFLRAVHQASDRNLRAVDERLLIGAASPGSTLGSENIGADGGYLVPTEFANSVTQISLDHDAFLPLCDNIPVSGNSVTFPSDETTPWGSNGVRVYWAGEAAAATATKPIIKPNTMRLNKLIGLVPVTNELIADAPAMSGYLQNLLGRSIKWKVNDAIVNGTGAGQPLGILNAPGLATVNKESGQATLTLDPKNIAKMYAAMPADYLSGAVWLITPDLLPYLMTMTLGNFAIWTPPTAGFAGAPGGFLFGKPIILTQTCQAFSSKGDILFVNFKAYRTISKDGVQIAESLHLYFDYDSEAYRATFRIDGQPTYKAPVTQARGAQALSPYVVLQAR